MDLGNVAVQLLAAEPDLCFTPLRPEDSSWLYLSLSVSPSVPPSSGMERGEKKREKRRKRKK